MLQFWLVLFATYLVGVFSHVDGSSVNHAPLPGILISSPINGEILESSTLVIQLEVENFVMPLLGRRMCVGLASKAPEWRHEVCFDEVVNDGLMAVDNLVLGAQYTLRVLLEDAGLVAATALRFFTVGCVQLPNLPPSVEQLLRASDRLEPNTTIPTMTVEDAILLGTQLMWGTEEEVVNAADQHRVWVAPSTAEIQLVRPSDAADPWRVQADPSDTATESSTNSDSSRTLATEVFKAVLVTKPEQSDAAHGIALAQLQSGDFEECVTTLENALDFIEISKTSAVRTYNAQQLQRQEQLNLDAPADNDDGQVEEEEITEDIFADIDDLDAFEDDQFEAWLLGIDDTSETAQDSESELLSEVGFTSLNNNTQMVIVSQRV